MMLNKTYRKHIDAVIRGLGKEKISCLQLIFESLHGTPPRLSSRRYRADHHSELTHLNQLEQSLRLIEQDDRQEFYKLSPYALPLIQTKRSEYLIDVMSKTYDLLRIIYNERLNKPITAKEICESLSQPKHDTLESLYYLSNISGIWSGKANSFPYEEDSTLTINESVVEYESLLDFFQKYYSMNGAEFGKTTYGGPAFRYKNPNFKNWIKILKPSNKNCLRYFCNFYRWLFYVCKFYRCNA